MSLLSNFIKWRIYKETKFKFMEKINKYNLLTQINNNDEIINYNIKIDRLEDTKKTYINMYFLLQLD